MAKGILSDEREKFAFGTTQLAKFITSLVKKSSKNKQSDTDAFVRPLNMDRLIGASSEKLKKLSSSELNAIRKETISDIRKYKTDPSPNARSEMRLEELDYLEDFLENLETEQYLRTNPRVSKKDALTEVRLRKAEQEAEDLGIEAAEIAMEKAERGKKQVGGLLADDREKFVLGTIASKLGSLVGKKNKYKIGKKEEANLKKYFENINKKAMQQVKDSEGYLEEDGYIESINEFGSPTFISLNNIQKAIKGTRDKKQDGGELQNPEKADLDNDGKLSSYEEARGEAIEENMREQKQVGGMMMDDQMADMMEEEENEMPMDNQMADMMPEEKTAEQKAIEEAQAPDEKMEDNYVDFLIDEALDENEEEGMLMQELQANPQLSMLFDKVMEVAMEFSGSGPVEGPGSEVSDSIPARLSDGEFVFTAKAVDVLGADNLMLLMKQAEAQAEQRQPAQEGGLMEEENTAMPVQQEPVRQDIRVTKETVGSQAVMQEEEDLVGDELKKSMLSTRPYVRS